MKHRLLLLIALLTSFSFVVVRAQDLVLGIGGRAGVTLDPDQVHFGIHANLGELVENLQVRPNVEVGAGSDMTVVTINPEVAYMFRQTRKSYVPYAGGGIGLNIIDHRKSVPGASDRSFEVGLNILGGIEFETSRTSSLFLETKLGVGDSPDVKFTFGFTLKR